MSSYKCILGMTGILMVLGSCTADTPTPPTHISTGESILSGSTLSGNISSPSEDTPPRIAGPMFPTFESPPSLMSGSNLCIQDLCIDTTKPHFEVEGQYIQAWIDTSGGQHFTDTLPEKHEDFDWTQAFWQSLIHLNDGQGESRITVIALASNGTQAKKEVSFDI